MKRLRRTVNGVERLHLQSMLEQWSPVFCYGALPPFMLRVWLPSEGEVIADRSLEQENWCLMAAHNGSYPVIFVFPLSALACHSTALQHPHD
jgi:hypothetical protein